MYIRELQIQHLKRLRDFELRFPDRVSRTDGDYSMPWTVLIGENGTCKTAILQAIALAAAGGRQVNTLAQHIVGHLVDKRTSQTMLVNATFAFPPDGWVAQARFYDKPKLNEYIENLQVGTVTDLAPGEDIVYSMSRYEIPGHDLDDDPDEDPLDEARSKGMQGWFVAAYGVSRVLPDSATVPSRLTQIDRLKPLFDPSLKLAATGFANYFADDRARTRRFAKVLHDVLFPAGREPLLPELREFTLTGRGGVTKASDLQDRHRFTQRLGGHVVGIPATALAHGYQSTIAWIADLVGHMILEAGAAVRPAQMSGLVLVDEIDLYIHPTLQVALIRSLKQTFPRIQFVVTTHSPLILAGLRPDEDEIVRLVVDEATGDVVRKDMKGDQPHEPDARTMTTAGLYQRYFGLDRIFGGPEGAWLAEYQSKANNPYRDTAADTRLKKLRKELTEAGVETVPPVDRAKR